MPLRIERQTATAELIADRLAAAPQVARLIYPGRDDHPQAAVVRRQMRRGSTLVSFEMVGGKAGAFAFANGLKLIQLSNNLGDAKSLITHPATTTHQSIGAEARAHLGIADSLLRLSVGLEDPHDLIEDIERGLVAVDRLAERI